MLNLEKITNDGFSLENRDNIKNLAHLSLNIALRAYFATFKNMKYSLHLFEGKSSTDQATIDYNHFLSYCESCFKTIIHFQHFIELIIKDLLRKEHILLADTSPQKHVVLFKLLKKKKLTQEELAGVKSIEFSEALERILELIKNKKMKNKRLKFITEAKAVLDKLNLLRNRLWHKGTFILRYPALDQFTGNFILPLMINVLKLPEYKNIHWTYNSLKCGINPVKEIVNEFKNGKYNLGKIAFLKELGRAAYENPLFDYPFGSHFNDIYTKRAERAAESDEPNVSEVKSCPVCGVKSLVLYEDVDCDDDETTGKHYYWRYSYEVKCMCCSFEVNNHLKNPSDYGLPIEDYWYVQDMTKKNSKHEQRR